MYGFDFHRSLQFYFAVILWSIYIWCTFAMLLCDLSSAKNIMYNLKLFFVGCCFFLALPVSNHTTPKKKQTQNSLTHSLSQPGKVYIVGVSFIYFSFRWRYFTNSMVVVFFFFFFFVVDCNGNAKCSHCTGQLPSRKMYESNKKKINTNKRFCSLLDSRAS